MTQPVSYLRVNWARKLPFEDRVCALTPAMYLRLGEGAGTAAFDRWGGNHGAVTGCTLAQTALLPEDSATSFHFDGVDDKIAIASSSTLNLGDTFWFACVIQRHAVGAAMTLADKGTGGWQVGIDASNYLHLTKTGTGVIVRSSTTLTDTASAHLIVVRKVAGACAIFIDGQDLTGTITNQTITNTALSLTIGATVAGAAFYHGLMQEVGYGATLTDTQAFGLYVALAQGEYGGAFDDVTSKARSLHLSRGRNGDFSGEATSSMSFTLRNDDQRFIADRNLCPNPSFEHGLDGWLMMYGPFGVTATSMRPAYDHATATGSWAAQIVGSGAAYSGVYLALEGTFYAGTAYTASVWCKSVSGSTSIAIGMANSSSSDEANNATAISGSWAAKTVTWTPAATTTAAWLYVRCNAAAAATWRIDCVQINAGTTANTYIEAPTRPMLDSGSGVRFYATYGGTTYPKFTGVIERISPYPREKRTDVTCYGMERALATPVSIVSTASTARGHRARLLDAAWGSRLTYALPGPNLCTNPSFAVDTTGWTTAMAQNLPPTNKCTNPSGATDTTGWAVTTSAYITAAGATLARDTTTMGSDPGASTRFSLVFGAQNRGARFPCSGTFSVGKTYYVFLSSNQTNSNIQVGIGSTGTTTDKATTTIITPSTALVWSPTANRADVEFFIKCTDISTGCPGTLYFNCVAIWEASSGESFVHSDLMHDGSTFLRNQYVSVTRKTGETGTAEGTSLEVVTRAKKGSGTGAIGSGTTWTRATVTALIWTTSGTANLTMSIGSNSNSLHDCSTTAIVATTTKIRYAVSRILPSAAGYAPFFYVAATDAVAYTFRVSDVRIEIGGPLTPFEPPEAAGLSTSEDDQISYVFAGDAWSGLTDLCRGTGARHWIEATNYRPFWKYVTSSRERIDTQAVAETLSTPQDLSGLERDGGSVANYVIWVSAGSSPRMDANTERVRRLGGYHKVEIGSTTANPTSAVDRYDYINRYLARYQVPRMRPRMVQTNSFTSQLVLQLDDLVAATTASAALYKARFLVMTEELAIDYGNTVWQTTRQLEEAP